jgi:hypothetical protein
MIRASDPPRVRTGVHRRLDQKSCLNSGYGPVSAVDFRDQHGELASRRLRANCWNVADCASSRTPRHCLTFFWKCAAKISALRSKARQDVEQSLSWFLFRMILRSSKNCTAHSSEHSSISCFRRTLPTRLCSRAAIDAYQRDLNVIIPRGGRLVRSRPRGHVVALYGREYRLRDAARRADVAHHEKIARLSAQGCSVR